MRQLKAGERIVIDRYTGGMSRIQKLYRFAEVLEVGKVKIKTTLGDFKAKNGSEWGSSSYYGDYICDITPEEATERNKSIIKNNHKIRLCAKFESSIKWANLSIEQLEQIDAIADPKQEQSAE